MKDCICVLSDVLPSFSLKTSRMPFGHLPLAPAYSQFHCTNILKTNTTQPRKEIVFSKKYNSSSLSVHFMNHKICKDACSDLPVLILCGVVRLAAHLSSMSSAQHFLLGHNIIAGKDIRHRHE